MIRPQSSNEAFWGTLPVALTVLVAGVVVSGCMEDEILDPELLEDPEDAIIYFPGRGDAWERREPAEAGFSPLLLEEAIDYAMANETKVPTDLRVYLESRSEGRDDQEITGPVKDRGSMNGLVLHRGYLVAEWGDTDQVDMVFSVTKSFLSTLIGLAADRNLIADLNDPVATTVGDGGYDSKQNAPITWYHSLRQTSEWEGKLWGKADTADRREGIDRELQEPGTFWEYNDVRVNRTALSAARVWEQGLADVLDREIMTPIGASRSWRWHGYRDSTVEIGGQEVESVSGGGHWGGGLWISSRDLARFGLLYLRRGLWREERLLSEEWIDVATTASNELNPTYGHMWWLNTAGELWPSASEDSYGSLGSGSNLLLIDPVLELVLVVRWIESGAEDDFIEKIIAAAG